MRLQSASKFLSLKTDFLASLFERTWQNDWSNQDHLSNQRRAARLFLQAKLQDSKTINSEKMIFISSFSISM